MKRYSIKSALKNCFSSLKKGLISLLFIFSFALQAQEPAYIHYSVKDGLPSATVYHVIQDHQGFIWFATDAGVSRFDGVNFKNFDLSDGLSDLEVLKLFQDSKHRIWFLTFNGKLSYYLNGKIFNAGNDSVLAKVRNSSPLFSAFEDSDKGLWFSSNNITYIREGQLFNFEGDSEPVAVLKLGKSIVIPTLLPGGFWEKNVDKINKETNLRVDYIYNSQCRKMFVRPGKSTNMVCLNDSVFLSIWSNTFFTFSEGECRIISVLNFLPVDFQPNHMLMDKRSNLWLSGSNSGAIQFYFDGDLKILGQFLKSENVSSVYNDSEENYWFTTLKNGVFFTNSLGERNSNSSFIRSSPITGISRLSGHLVLISDNSLKTIERGVMIDHKEMLTQSQIRIPRKILRRKNGKILICGDGGAFELYEAAPNSWKMDSINFILTKDIAEDENGKLWFVKFKESPLPEIPLNLAAFGEIKNHLRFNEILACPGGKFFFGTTAGVYSYQEKLLTRWADKDSLFGGAVSLIERAPDGAVWIATFTNGVARIMGHEFQWFRRKDGLIGDYCKALHIDSTGTAWIGTNQGMSRLVLQQDGKTYSIRNYSTADGLGSDDVNAIYREGDTLYVGTGEGLSILHINSIDKPLAPPPVFFTRIRIMDRDTLVQDTFLLPYNFNNIKIDFVGISFRSGGKLLYKYRLKGLDDRFSFTNQSAVQYPTLLPGKYEFEVWAQAKDGTWSAKPAIVLFIIHPPWWATWWFRTLMLIVIILVVSLGFIFRIREINERNEIEKRLSELKIQALGLQMNPHFIFNSLNSVHHFISINDKDTARSYLAKFGKLVRGILDQSFENSVSIKKEIELIDLYLSIEKLRLGEKLEYEIRDEYELAGESVKIPAMLIQPFIENAIWHGIGHNPGGGKITIEFREEGDFIRVIVEDNGIGREAAKQFAKEKSHKSMSTSSIRDRLTLLNKEKGVHESVITEDLLDNIGKGAGTRITIVIPIVG